MGTRITLDLGSPVLLKLLKNEATSTGTSMKDVVVKCLESYFSDRLESKALARIADKVFEEWQDPMESAYDDL